MSKPTGIPAYDELMNPTIRALKVLGGSGAIEEINAKVIELVGLSEEQQSVLHDPKRGNETEVEYRLAWARTYLKKYGVLENSSRGVWALTPQGIQIDRVDPHRVKQFVAGQQRSQATRQREEDRDDRDGSLEWRNELMGVLLQMEPAAFERLAQRLLREAGFTQVEVIGRSGDGGIDGRGIMRLGGLLSFHVFFQCKRYRGSVTASQIRDFRGAMVGRGDKGLLITTGNFTKDAIQEATRDGAPAIDLIDGDQLVDRLKELALGVQTNRIEIEQVSVDPAWFSRI